MVKRFPSLVRRVFDVVENEDGLHHCGRPGWAAAQLGQDFPDFESGDGAFAAAADPGVDLVHGLLPARQLRPVAVPLERGTHGTAGALAGLSPQAAA
jgi:hypothetical protein